MKKPLLTALIALALAACGGANEKSTEQKTDNQPATASAANTNGLPKTDALNIYNWSNYVDETTVDEFK